LGPRVRRLGGVLVFAALVVGLLEIALRVAPGALVPLDFLERFRREPRLEIARRLELPTEQETWELSRTDDGPTLLLRKPGTRIVFDFKSPGEQGVVVMDGKGFCNPPENGWERPEIDVITVGDSFTECIVVPPDHTWTSQLGRLTGRSVYALARGGVGPYEYLQILEQLGLEKHPSVVVMNVYEGNDLRDTLRYQEYRAATQAGGSPRMLAHDRNVDPVDTQAWLDHPLGRRSWAVNLLAVAGVEAGEGIHKALTGGGRRREPVNFRYRLRFPDGDVPFNVQDSDESEVRHARLLRQGEASLSAFDPALERFAELAREHDFTPVVAYSPSAYTAYADFVAFEDPALAELMPWFHAEQLAHLRGRAEALGLRFVDLTPALQEAARSLGGRELLYFPANVHYTARGHQVVAETLARELAAGAAN
jgi:hypothetical protein